MNFDFYEFGKELISQEAEEFWKISRRCKDVMVGGDFYCFFYNLVKNL